MPVAFERRLWLGGLMSDPYPEPSPDLPNVRRPRPIHDYGQDGGVRTPFWVGGLRSDPKLVDETGGGDQRKEALERLSGIAFGSGVPVSLGA